ncbi:MAG TPA: hypothetical protein VFU33_11730 [Gaiellaceae bacterium]|nr:hypothetical protein [Gaiellaceae bacterium]
MWTEIAERRGVEERRRRRRHDDLPPVRERGDARAAVDVLADVALLGRGRSSRVQAHAHANRSRGQPFARRLRGGGRSGGCRKREKESVALGVDLDAAVRGRRLTNDSAVLGERARVPR